MVPDAATVARRRYLLTMVTRALVLVLAAMWFTDLIDRLREVYAGNAIFFALPEIAFGEAAYAVSAVLLVVFERRLVSWVVPLPRSGCPRCGYWLGGLTRPKCPECGLVLTAEFLEPEAGSDTPAPRSDRPLPPPERPAARRP